MCQHYFGGKICSCLLPLLLANLCSSHLGTIPNSATLYFVIPSSGDSPEASNRTLNDWISNDSTNLFTNDTEVILLPGIHEIEHSPSYILIENVHSLAIIGKGRNITQVVCRQNFYFHFMFSKNVRLSNFEITNCSYILQDMMYGNVMLESVLYQSVHVIIDATQFSFVFSDSDNLTFDGISIQHMGGVFVHHNVPSNEELNSNTISTIDFKDNNISISSGVAFGFVIPQRIQKPVLNFTVTNNILNHACFFVIMAHNTPVLADMHLKDFTMLSPKCDEFSPLTFTLLRNSHFQDVRISYGNNLHETYFEVVSQSVTISGSIVVTQNKHGSTYISACNVTLNPGTTIHFVDNPIQYRITFKPLLFINLWPTESLLKVEHSEILFQNNRVRSGRIMQVDNGRCRIISSIITFKNNTCMTAH